MKALRLSAFSIITVFTLSLCGENTLLTMKVKKLLYEYIGSFKDIDASGIICEITPQKRGA